MTRKPSRRLASNSDGIPRITDSARRGELVVIVGTGVSIGLTDNKIPALSWRGLISDGFAYGLQKARISSTQAKTWRAQLDSSDIDDLLGAAEFMARKLDAPHGDLYARWLENVFGSVRPSNNKLHDAIRAMSESGVPLCTLNYDTLLESVTGLSPVNIGDTAKIVAWMRRETASIFHLHGSWDAPSSCILGIRDYMTTVGDSVRDLIQRSLGSFHRLLFVGCGDTFSDPNFSALVRWLRTSMGAASPEHYALVTDGELPARHADADWQGFVTPQSYGATHSQLPEFLLRYIVPSEVVTSGRASERGGPTPQNAKVLQDYRSFLVKDCGQMTIEGVRADMDTAQRKFDLERLFIPLHVLPSPPEIPESDPQREKKLLAWREKNKKPRPFGKIFAKRRRLALLALPGGGKTLLLKRLAVAYAEAGRRRASEDGLPELDLLPVLIRCREWREHIHRPISTLLQSIPEITGQASLSGLSDALLPMFKTGRILLLVDGLDEIHDDGLRTTFVDNLEKFLDDFKLTRLVVTSREAGFGLVAPCLARFCERWRVAPLEDNAILALCDHWHRLMTGDSPEAKAEGSEVANSLLRNGSLRRLAENPLLLTMLLVVKHGAGRLPPDRVSLYSRAVEVLLDTWNIRGHDPLNAKEAVPQLACVAFQLMQKGKQTATGKELLDLLEEARERVPQIRRRAKDTPQDFLKRVELRSSLVVEGGRQAEGTGTVPFYQFRHLTFQEYLAAVAAFEGHYLEYEKTDSILTPLEPYLSAEEWKEVIPMCAVLAGKQAEPIMAALVERGREVQVRAEAGEDYPGKRERAGHPAKMPAPVSRLAQCLVEEAEAAPETLTAALQLITLFADGCRSGDDWLALSRGPYGEELLHQAWLLYTQMLNDRPAWVINTFATLSAHRASLRDADAAGREIQRLLNSETDEDIGRGLGTIVGIRTSERSSPGEALHVFASLTNSVRKQIFHDEPAIWTLAAWAFILIKREGRQNLLEPQPELLDRLLSLFLGDPPDSSALIVGYALTQWLGMKRDSWKPALTEPQVEKLRSLVKRSAALQNADDTYIVAGSLMICFHAKNVLSEPDLAKRFLKVSHQSRFAYGGSRDPVQSVLKQIAKGGSARLKPVRRGKATVRQS